MKISNILIDQLMIKSSSKEIFEVMMSSDLKRMKDIPIYLKIKGFVYEKKNVSGLLSSLFNGQEIEILYSYVEYGSRQPEKGMKGTCILFLKLQGMKLLPTRIIFR